MPLHLTSGWGIVQTDIKRSDTGPTALTYLPKLTYWVILWPYGKAHTDHRIWQDVYRPAISAGEVYLKLTVVDEVLVVSFKEL
ncbi:MAG: hypothetical protein FJ015_07705 [Chloroflexi bacterium]|nr:hypothetical protein [Chloroflexota bacterium]